MHSGETRYGAGDLLAVPAIRRDGSRISIEFSIALLTDAQGSVEGAVAVIRDVTERWNEQKGAPKAARRTEGGAEPSEVELQRRL
jgi:hypothetical protein